MTTTPSLFRNALVLMAGLALPAESRAWDYEGHRLINQLALESLPANFPSFVLTSSGRERVAFLAGEADRWRNTSDLPLKHCNGPDHFFDIDLLPLYDLNPSQLSPFRYEFCAQLALDRAARPKSFPPVDPQRDADRTRTLIGFLPWTITEHQAKLKSAFSYLKEYEAAGTPEEVANAQQNVIYIMGVMGHFVGDGSQPLHTTRHHHGWVGRNPHHYSTNYSIHSWIDGGYIQQFGVNRETMRQKLRPARLLSTRESTAAQTNLFPLVMSYLLEQYRQVEPLYQLEKAGKLSGRREVSEEGRNFIAGQMLQAAQMLGDLWLTAWQQAAPDMYLRSALARRKSAKSNNTE
jgi:hypothetical protein